MRTVVTVVTFVRNVSRKRRVVPRGGNAPSLGIKYRVEAI